jgi:hypothetical protein
LKVRIEFTEHTGDRLDRVHVTAASVEAEIDLAVTRNALLQHAKKSLLGIGTENRS